MPRNGLPCQRLPGMPDGERKSAVDGRLRKKRAQGKRGGRLRFAPRRHRRGVIQQKITARIDLLAVQFDRQLPGSRIDAPVQTARIVAGTVVPVFGELERVSASPSDAPPLDSGNGPGGSQLDAGSARKRLMESPGKESVHFSAFLPGKRKRFASSRMSGRRNRNASRARRRA